MTESGLLQVHGEEADSVREVRFEIQIGLDDAADAPLRVRRRAVLERRGVVRLAGAEAADSARAEGEEERLDDAREALQLAKSQPSGTTVDPTDLVRSLCRMAVDNALRLFVIQEAIKVGRDPGPDLLSLDAVHTTGKRITAVKELHPASTAVTAAQQHLPPEVLLAWNRAAHGNPPDSTVQADEIDAAESACAVLLGSP